MFCVVSNLSQYSFFCSSFSYFLFFFIFLLNSILFPEEFVQWGKKTYTQRESIVLFSLFDN